MKVKFKEKTTDVDRQQFIRKMLIVSTIGLFLTSSTASFDPRMVIASDVVQGEVEPETEELTSSESEIISTDYDFTLYTSLLSIQDKLQDTTEKSEIDLNAFQMFGLENPLNTSNETNTTINFSTILSQSMQPEETISDMPLIDELHIKEKENIVIDSTILETEESVIVIEEEPEDPPQETEAVFQAMSTRSIDMNEMIIIEEDVEFITTMQERKSEPRLKLSAEEKEILCRITEAEVTGSASELATWKHCSEEEALMSKFNVARTIVNRVHSTSFPNSVEGVVFESGQFSPIRDGRYWSVHITDTTRKAVELALDADVSSPVDRALYFRSDRGNWNNLEFLFKDAVGHKFYTE